MAANRTVDGDPTAPASPPGSHPSNEPNAAPNNGPTILSKTPSGDGRPFNPPPTTWPAITRCAGACNGLANVSRFRRFRDYARLRIITFYTRVRICSRLFLTIYDISCIITLKLLIQFAPWRRFCGRTRVRTDTTIRALLADGGASPAIGGANQIIAGEFYVSTFPLCFDL
jgi:hypothetical protein